MSNSIYENKIVSLGNDVKALGDEMVILFGDSVPDTLKDFCYMIEPKQIDGEISVGQRVVIEGEDFEILAVGEIAQKNLVDLGHLTINFSGDKDSLLPGAIVVEKKACPEIKVGTIISIVK